jgi:asparagine synthase (glutamine-hydrolysing)
LNPEAQPIFNEDGSLCIVMDGEVFDYERERRRLEGLGHRFRFRDNDAEYCLHLYEEYGDDALVRLNGSFVLMLYDAVERELVLANDRFASYPLYYFHDGRQTLFGTQVRPLVRFQGLPRRLDLQTVYEFFTLGRVLPGHTYYKDVSALPPASVVRFRAGRIERSRYWTPKYGGDARSETDYVDALAEALKAAVERKTRGSLRLGLLLSGGMDSRTVVACADRPLVAFTMADFENREVRIARRVAQARGWEHVFLRRDPDHYPDLVSEAVAIGDGMRRFDHAHVLGLIPAIRGRCDVLLESLNFDSSLKGSHLLYQRRSCLGKTFHTPALARVGSLEIPQLWRRTRAYKGDIERLGLFHPRYARDLSKTLVSSLNEMTSQVRAEDAHNLIEYPMAGSLSSKGSSVMSLSIRAHMGHRLVIADNDLWSVGLSIPPRLRARGRVLRKALQRLSPDLAAIPNANTGFRADLPVWLEWALVSSRIALQEVGVLPRPRVPHPTFTQQSWPQMGALIRHNEKLRTMLDVTLHDPRCIDPRLFRVDVVDSVFKQHLVGKAEHANLLFALLTFGQWHRDYGPT